MPGLIDPTSIPLSARAGAAAAARPDASAARLRDRLGAHFRSRRRHRHRQLGRAWRRGTVGVALGAAGLPALRDLRGRSDLFGTSCV
jgi:coenzyme F420-0:L-glutamate ligase/coenzyme F420-1:gamma-L-glutamate ligase